jgi:L-ascorbate metabolism protein UlaG (beta-lactamase superfamily)
MKPAASIILSLACLFFLGGCAAPVAQEPATPAPVFTRTASPLETATGNFHWFRFSACLYHGSKNVYFDPVSLSGDLPPADLILITHSHADSWSLSDIKKIVGPNTTLVVGTNAAPKYETFKDQIDAPAIILDEGESAEVDGIKITAPREGKSPAPARERHGRVSGRDRRHTHLQCQRHDLLP